MDTFDATFGDFHLITCPDKLPDLHDEYHAHALLSEKFDLNEPEGAFCFVGISWGGASWPQLVVSQRYNPAGYGFNPGILIVPDTRIAFLGAGERLLAYRLGASPERLWEDSAYVGFCGWAQHGSSVLMMAELELTAWSVEAKKLWSASVEPPWSYRVEGQTLHLDIMGTESSFPLSTGPRA